MKKIILIALLVMIVFTGCMAEEDDVGVARVSFNLGNSAESEEGAIMGSIRSYDISYIELTIDPANIVDVLCGIAPESEDLSGWSPAKGECNSAGDLEGGYDALKTFMVPIGMQTFTAVAYDASNTEIARGSVQVHIMPGSTNNVYIEIFDSTGAAEGYSHSPLITSLSLSNSTPVIGEAITATVTAFDADDDSLLYYWLDDCDGGSFVSTNTASVSWSGSVSESCELTVVVSDGQYNASASIAVNVYETGVSTEQTVISTNLISHPYIMLMMISSETNVRYCRINKGTGEDRDNYNATCTRDVFFANSSYILNSRAIVESADASDITWTVESSCGGTMGNDSAQYDQEYGSSEYEVVWNTPSTPGPCVLSFSINNRGMVDTVDLALLLK